MINPSCMYRAKALVVEFETLSTGDRIYFVQYLFTRGGQTKLGSVMKTFPIPELFDVGQMVNIQFKFSIALDQYVIKTINKPRKRAQKGA